MTRKVTAAVIMNMHYSGLGIARALAQSGARVVGLSFDDSFFGNHTRFIEFKRYPNPQFQPEDCLRFLLDLSREIDHLPLLLPTRDIDVLFIMQHRETLAEHFTIMYPGNAVLDTILQKDRLYEAAQKINVDCPFDISISDMASLQAALPRLTFPVIAKPVVAADWRQPEVWQKVGCQKIRRFSSPDDLHSFYESLVDLAPRLSLQNYIDGPDTDLRIVGCYRSQSGHFCYFSLRKLLQYPKEAGTGIVLETCQEEKLAEQCNELLQTLGYHGIAEIEFKLDRSTDKFVLIEINTRHWDQHYLGSAVGINLSQIMLDDANGLLQQSMSPRKEAVKWVADDEYINVLIHSLKRSEYNLSYTLKCFQGKRVFAVFSTKDFRPFLALAGSTLRSLFRRLSARLTNKQPHQQTDAR